MAIGDWAERYAVRGFPIFPCHTARPGGVELCTCEAYTHSEWCRRNRPHGYWPPDKHCASPGKHPRVVGWQALSTSNISVVQEWWTRWAHANIGVDCGKADKLIVDADTYKDCFTAPRFKLDEETVTTLTPSGGTHLWYEQPADVKFGCRKGVELPDGIDIRGVGNLVIVPPSLGVSGRRYEFELGYSPGDIAIAPLPDVLREILERAQHSGRSCTTQPSTIDVKAVRRSQQIVERVLACGQVEYVGPKAWMNGLVYILTECPFNCFNMRGELHPMDLAAYVSICSDGRIAASCHHERCRNTIASRGLSGWHWLRQIVSIRLATSARSDQP